ncbi:hypothetical protein EMGBS1_02980 [Chloroflexota bacterium]|nr:hypothetical protein EMGBS1_02980 [Chloroflexota bacterium]
MFVSPINDKPLSRPEASTTVREAPPTANISNLWQTLEGTPALPVDEAQLSSNREFAQGSHQELRQLNEQLQTLQQKQQDSDVKIDGLVRTAQRAYEATNSLSKPQVFSLASWRSSTTSTSASKCGDLGPATLVAPAFLAINL